MLLPLPRDEGFGAGELKGLFENGVSGVAVLDIGAGIEAGCLLLSSPSQNWELPNCASNCFCCSSAFLNFSSCNFCCCSCRDNLFVDFEEPKLTRFEKLSLAGVLDFEAPEIWGFESPDARIDTGVEAPEDAGGGVDLIVV